jgi:hypothetical protein
MSFIQEDVKPVKIMTYGPTTERSLTDSLILIVVVLLNCMDVMYSSSPGNRTTPHLYYSHHRLYPPLAISKICIQFVL